ncbi:MAG: hypothetical protein NT027_15100 [Proteobacteria bacterium]|nr:hypothetical protein [Pseudomonadota bacterium]
MSRECGISHRDDKGYFTESDVNSALFSSLFERFLTKGFIGHGAEALNLAP